MHDGALWCATQHMCAPGNGTRTGEYYWVVNGVNLGNATAGSDGAPLLLLAMSISPIGLLNAEGALGRNTTIVHGTWLGM